MQGPEYMWVANGDTVRPILKSVFTSLARVMEDITHLLRRGMRILPPGHPSNSKHPSASYVAAFEGYSMSLICAFAYVLSTVMSAHTVCSLFQRLCWLTLCMLHIVWHCKIALSDAQPFHSLQLSS